MREVFVRMYSDGNIIVSEGSEELLRTFNIREAVKFCLDNEFAVNLESVEGPVPPGAVILH